MFYPAVRSLGSQKADDLVLRALKRHHVVDLVLEELPRLDVGDEHFVPGMSVLAEVFTLATRLGERDLESLGVRMAAPAEEMLRELRQDPVRLLAFPA